MGFWENVEDTFEEEKEFMESIYQFRAADAHNSQTFEALSHVNAQMANNMSAQM